MNLKKKGGGGDGRTLRKSHQCLDFYLSVKEGRKEGKKKQARRKNPTVWNDDDDDG